MTRDCARELALTTPSAREIVLARTFDAGRDLVFDAFTTPELLVRWYGATGWQLVECEIELRPGGAYRLVSAGPGGVRMVQAGTYLSVDRPVRVVLTELFDDQSYPGETVITHDFAEHAGSTTVTTTLLFATAFGQDTALGYPMAQGLGEGYRRLDAVLG